MKAHRIITLSLVALVAYAIAATAGFASFGPVDFLLSVARAVVNLG